MRVRTPAPRDVSIVVQGPVIGTPADPMSRRLTRRCVDSIRRHLPGAEIVVSTWKGSDVSDLPYDLLVESDDPGAARYDDGSNASPSMYTGNRQITSSLAGLRAATRPYAMKLRSDVMFTSAVMLDRFGTYPSRSDEWRILRERVLVPTYFTCNPRSKHRYPFHPSDWCQFGLREDVLNIWDIPLAPPEIIQWYATRPQPENEVLKALVCRYYVEQYVWLTFLRKHGDVPFEHKTDDRPEMVALSDLSFANNLQIVALRDLGLRFLKAAVPLHVLGALYTAGDWERLYQHYCDPAFRPAIDRRRLIYSAYMSLSSPSSSTTGAALSVRWRRSMPRSFGLAKRVYVAGLETIRRLNARVKA